MMTNVNLPDLGAPIADLTNVGLCLTALHRAMNRPDHLPGMVCFYGPSGWGKSMACARAANLHRAYYVECRDTWNRKKLLSAVLGDMAVVPGRTLYDMLDQAAEQLAVSRRPLILDEADKLIDRGMIEMIRDLYEQSGAAIMLVGEELLPAKLRRFERFHGRILHWAPAQPVDMPDASLLRELYATRVPVEDALLARIVKVAKGSARRVAVNLEHTQEIALAEGWEMVTLDSWGNRGFYTGEAPKRGERLEVDV